MCWIGAASLTRKETELRGCMPRLAREWVSRTGPPAPPRVVGQNGTRPSPWIRVFKLRMAFREELGKGEEWDPIEKKRNPCSSMLVESYLTFVTVEQRRLGVPVKQAAPMLVHTLAQLLQDM